MPESAFVGLMKRPEHFHVEGALGIGPETGDEIVFGYLPEDEVAAPFLGSVTRRAEIAVKLELFWT